MALSLDFIIAHRGERRYAPENTLVAIRQAAKKGAKWVEFDATLTRDTDKPAVIFHDDTVGRTTNLPDRPITAISFDELRAADAGSWFSESFSDERVPTLQEVVALCREVGLAMNIEIKVSGNGDRENPEPFDANLARLTARRVVEDLMGRHDNILLSSFSTEALLLVRQAVPDVPRGYLLHQLWPDDLFDDHLPEFCRRLALIQPQTLNLNHELLSSRQKVDLFRAAIRATLGQDLPILAYTVNDRIRAEKLREWGISAVFTDCPGDLLNPSKETGAEQN